MTIVKSAPTSHKVFTYEILYESYNHRTWSAAKPQFFQWEAGFLLQVSEVRSWKRTFMQTAASGKMGSKQSIAVLYYWWFGCHV